MTIKLKIILGFISLMAITIIASFIGYRSIQTSIHNFNSYIVFAESNEDISDFLSKFGKAYASALSYLSYDKEEEIKNISIFMNEAIKYLDDMSKVIDSPQKREEIIALKKYSLEYRDETIKFCELIFKSKDIYENVMRPASRVVMIALNKLAKHAKDAKNISLLEEINTLWTPYSKLLSAYGRYVNSSADKDKIKVLLWLNTSLKAIEVISSTIQTDQGLEVFNELKKSFKIIEEATLSIVKNIDEFEKTEVTVFNLREKIFEESAILSDYAKLKKAESYAIAKDSNTTGSQNMLISSIAGVIIGLTLAFFIVISLIRVLKDISGFATAIANGHFKYVVQSKEKGEVGDMVASMKQIPTVLQRLIDEIMEGIKKIQIGEFNTRLNSSEYKGSYVNISNAVNTVADAYTSLLDELPIPLLTANKNYDVFYTNKEGRKTLNGKLIESYVTDGEKEFGRKAIEKGSSYIAEANFKKDGKAMCMTVTAIPLKDSKGAFPTFIEILTDLTAIRDHQKAMLQAAKEATEISIRVASTSEQIAAQIEQVSRGADIQRARVESTASAMTEMNSTVIEVARSAGDAAKQCDSTMSKAQDGAELVNKVISAINQVNHVSQNLHTNMQELGTQAENIGSVMNVISDIADQTNLLALNAAIEAARAGEAGRGFAVVADEVRKLAEKTMVATQEVGSSISAVQQSTRTNIEEVTEAVRSVEEANHLATSSGEALVEIVSLASANSDIVSSIATAAEQQSATSDEISQSINEINNIVSETAEGMVQSSSAIRDLSATAQDLRNIMRGLQ